MVCPGWSFPFESRKPSGVNPEHAERLRKILALLETSETMDNMDLPGLDFHNLKGKTKNTLAVRVSGNWRVTGKCQDIVYPSLKPNYARRSFTL